MALPGFLTRDSHRGAKPPMTSARRKKLILSYLPDWILTIGLAAAFFSLEKVEGFRRQFSLEETSIRHTYTLHERVPNTALGLIAVVAPLVLLPCVNILTVRSWWDFHIGTLGLILGLAMTGSITQAVKITVGRPRPDLIDRCQPETGAADPLYGLSTWHICTQTDNLILRDGFRSFPSGHSSLSFAGLGFLSFYLAGKLHLFDKRGHAFKAWLSLAPFLGAALVAVSRSMDYRHHWHDILTGSILGTICAYFAYRQYYPHLGSENSHVPFSPRIRRDYEDVGLPIHNSRSGSSDHEGHAYPPVAPAPGYSSGGFSQTQQRTGSTTPLVPPPLTTATVGGSRTNTPPRMPRRYTDEEPTMSPSGEYHEMPSRPDAQRQNTHEVWKDGEFASGGNASSQQRRDDLR